MAYSLDVDRYLPLCKSCHKRFDNWGAPLVQCAYSCCDRVAITDDLCSPHYHDALLFIPTQLSESPRVIVEEPDELGLYARDRKALQVLVSGWVDDEGFRGGPIGVSPLANSVGIKQAELIQDIEPRLVRAGLLVIRGNGRCATRDTYVSLGLPVPPLLNAWR